MGANRTPMDSSMTIKKAIEQGGYYNTDGDWNNVITLEEYPGKLFRGRVEVLILKENKLFMYMRENGNYRIPGGGFDKGVLNKDQAFIETKEEAKLIIENIKYTGVTYTHVYDEVWESNDNEIPYHGNYNEVYVATYKEDYHGYIRKGLSDMELTNKGKFYDLSEIEHLLREPHKQALANVFKTTVAESNTDDEILSTIEQLQVILQKMHNTISMYHCIQNRDIEPVDGGWLFAEFVTHNQTEVDEVKRFIQYCNNTIKDNAYTAFIDEPISYKSGFLVVKHNN